MEATSTEEARGHLRLKKNKSNGSVDPARSVLKQKKNSPRESLGPLVCFALSTYVSALLNRGQAQFFFMTAGQIL